MRDEDQRPDPDALLAMVRREEDGKRRGRLRIFLGMAPGVGKTYAMLEAARLKMAEGLDLLAGIVETHGREDTEALMYAMPVLARRQLDLQRPPARGVRPGPRPLARRPALILVDELAHTNVPGSRHPKRWQDVEELLEHGLDVWATLNVQHLESPKRHRGPDHRRAGAGDRARRRAGTGRIGHPGGPPARGSAPALERGQSLPAQASRVGRGELFPLRQSERAARTGPALNSQPGEHRSAGVPPGTLHPDHMAHHGTHPGVRRTVAHLGHPGAFGETPGRRAARILARPLHTAAAGGGAHGQGTGQPEHWPKNSGQTPMFWPGGTWPASSSGSPGSTM